jgi:hypothetical protein
LTVSEIEDDFQVPLQGVDKAVLEKVRKEGGREGGRGRGR